MNIALPAPRSPMLGDRWKTDSPGPTAETGMETGLPSVFPVVHTPYGLRRKV